MKKFALIVAAAAASSAPLLAAPRGEGHAGDIQIVVDNGRIMTGSIGSGAFVQQRVFASELGEIVPNISDEPGFEADAGTFTPGAALGFDIMDAVRLWDGADFDTVSDSTMTMSYLTFSATSAANAGESVAGFNFLANASGEIHNHATFILNSPATAGIYLLELRFRSAGMLDSDSFYIVFNQNQDEAIHDAAIDYVNEFIVPAPGALGVLAFAGIACARRRRA